ncbi:LCP family protein [Nocardioides sp. R1-1]|uniref:LCP family protein n=1 Tax=Nocardioides sp. R1-1 TaxID=3383502 RepID=UPI0038D03C3A
MSAGPDLASGSAQDTGGEDFLGSAFASARPAASDRRWMRRLFAIVVVVLVVLAGVVAGMVVYTDRQLGDISRFPLDVDRPDRPPATGGRALNLLVAAVDDPDGAERGPSVYEELASRGWTPGLFRSDAIMVLHLPADRRSAQLVSIPRDSYVAVPGHGRTKINAAFSYGGPRLLARTVEDLTGVRIDHAVVIGLTGLSRVADIVGGVELHLPEDTRSPIDGSTWPAGTRRLDGAEALAYVRERHSLRRGDFSRIQRQQNFLRALFAQVAGSGTLTSPHRLVELVGQLSTTIAVDAGMTNGVMRRLALQSRHLRADDLTFATVPVTGTPTIDGASVVTLDRPATRSMFAALAEDRLGRWLRTHTTDTLPPPEEVE